VNEQFGKITEVRMSPSARHVAWRYTDVSDPSYPWMSGPISPGATLMWLSDDGVAGWTELAPVGPGADFKAHGDVYVHLKDEMPLIEETLSFGKLGPMVNVDMSNGEPAGVEVIGALSVTIDGRHVIHVTRDA
jgi:hypothetical protein